LLALVLAAGLGAGCAHGGSHAAPATSGSSSPPAPSPISYQQHCTNELRYWAGQMLASTVAAGLDYQEMGLVASEWARLDAIVTHARQLARSSGQQAAIRYADTAVAQACATLAASPGPSGPTPSYGWPQ
jgi:hypothetical protein